MTIDFYNLPDDPKTWELLGTGKTAGIFQLENLNLGGRFAKKIKPKTIEDIAAIATIIRPGTLASELEDGESAAIHYERRHRGVEKPKSLHPALDKILESTQNILLYQEQTLQLSREVAGFDDKSAMKLLKGIGKKKADLILQLEEQFVEGCQKTSGLTKEDAQYIFNILKASARYAFNKSHAVEYSDITYQCAYAKANVPLEFYTATLRMAKNRVGHKAEIEKLVKEAAEFGIKVRIPQLKTATVDFDIIDEEIHFGLSNIKGIGEDQAQKVLDVRDRLTKLHFYPPRQVEDVSWYEWLLNIYRLKKTVVENCINCGLFGPDRRSKMDDYKNLMLLSDGEKKWVDANWKRYDNLLDLIGGVYQQCITRRKEKLESLYKVVAAPRETLEDNLKDTTRLERELLGCTVSFDNIDIVRADGNCTIQEFNEGRFEKQYRIVAEVARIKPYVIQKGPSEGKTMAFLSIFDRTGKMDIVAFDSVYDEFGGYFNESATLMFIGYRSKKGTFCITKVHQV